MIILMRRWDNNELQYLQVFKLPLSVTCRVYDLKIVGDFSTNSNWTTERVVNYIQS